MWHLVITVILLLALIYFLRSVSERVKYMPKRVVKPCEKQPHLECPYRVKYKGMVLTTEGHFKCCKIVDQVKTMNKLFCQMEPGKTYNGMSITEEVKKTALRCQKKFDDLDSSGPIGYKRD